MSKRIKFQGNEYMSVNAGIANVLFAPEEWEKRERGEDSKSFAVVIPIIGVFRHGAIIGSPNEIEEVG